MQQNGIMIKNNTYSNGRFDKKIPDKCSLLNPQIFFAVNISSQIKKGINVIKFALKKDIHFLWKFIIE